MKISSDRAMQSRLSASGVFARYGLSGAACARIVHLLEHFAGGRSTDDVDGCDAQVKRQLDSLDEALGAVNAAWWEVVRSPAAFAAIAEHYCEEALTRAECVERLRACLDLEPIRFAVRLARMQPWLAAAQSEPAPRRPARTQRDAGRLVLRLQEILRGESAAAGTDRIALIQDLLEGAGVKIGREQIEKSLAGAADSPGP